MVYNPTPAFAVLLKKSKSPSVDKKDIKVLANEARRIKETLLLSYLEKMGSYESNLPCDEEHLQTEHFDLSSSAIKEFDELIGIFSHQEYPILEKEDLIRRLNAHYTELKEKNQKFSEKLCSKLFEAVFKDVKGLVLTLECGHFNIEEIESKWHNAVIQYKSQALGTFAETVFMEEFPCFIPFMASIFREMEFQFQKLKEELEQGFKIANKHRDVARAGEQRLKDMLDETNRLFEQQLESREEIIKQLKSAMSSKISQLETKNRDQSRELHICKLELTQAIREKELSMESQKDLSNRAQDDLEAKIVALKIENNKYRHMIDELKDDKDKLLNEKNQILNDLTLKFVERRSEVEEKKPNKDSMKDVKKIVEDLFSKFEAESIGNYDTFVRIEELTRVRSELNDLKLQKHDEISMILRKFDVKFGGDLNKTGDERYTIEKMIDDLKEENRTLREAVRHMMEEFDLLKKSVEENESSYLYEVIDLHKNQIESFTLKIEDLSVSISDYKMNVSMLEDDNNKLIELLEAAVSYKANKPQQLKQAYGRIIDPNNRTAVKKVLNAKGITF